MVKLNRYFLTLVIALSTAACTSRMPNTNTESQSISGDTVAVEPVRPVRRGVNCRPRSGRPPR